MPITELTAFDLIAPHTLQSSPLSKLLQRLAVQQSAYSAYPVIFYSDTQRAACVYILSGWHDLEATNAWLESPE
ncbi:hypothetical protein DFH07DRAFT_717856, partial [Mycena maculata]